MADIYLFAAGRGTAHFLVEAKDQDKARDKLGSQFPSAKDADCLGSPVEIMDLHKPDVVKIR